MIMESMVLCLHFHNGAIREDGVVAKCKVYIIQGALDQALGSTRKMGVESILGVWSVCKAHMVSDWSKFRECLEQMCSRNIFNMR